MCKNKCAHFLFWPKLKFCLLTGFGQFAEQDLDGSNPHSVTLTEVDGLFLLVFFIKKAESLDWRGGGRVGQTNLVGRGCKKSGVSGTAVWAWQISSPNTLSNNFPLAPALQGFIVHSAIILLSGGKFLTLLHLRQTVIFFRHFVIFIQYLFFLCFFPAIKNNRDFQIRASWGGFYGLSVNMVIVQPQVLWPEPELGSVGDSDILVWIRIPGSVPLTNGSGSYFFFHWF